MTGLMLPMSALIASSFRSPQDVIGVAAFGVDGMPDDDFACALAVSIDAADPLFHHVRIV